MTNAGFEKKGNLEISSEPKEKKNKGTYLKQLAPVAVIERNTIHYIQTKKRQAVKRGMVLYADLTQKERSLTCESLVLNSKGKKEEGSLGKTRRGAEKRQEEDLSALKSTSASRSIENSPNWNGENVEKGGHRAKT